VKKHLAFKTVYAFNEKLEKNIERLILVISANKFYNLSILHKERLHEDSRISSKTTVSEIRYTCS